jgi:transcription elongation factor Elf1
MKKFYNKRRTFEKWMECQRCGFDVPYSSVVKDPLNGALVCPDCADELGFEELREQVQLPDEGRTEIPGGSHDAR